MGQPSDPTQVARRLAAIVAADVAGYSRLMGSDEAGTAQALREHRAAVDPIVGRYGGRIVKSTGDGVLLEFPSIVAAVECAVSIQAAMAERNTHVPEDRRMLFRIGINLGDVLIQDDDILGDGVNVAARLEGIAEPGGICISDNVHQQVLGKLDVGFEDIGPQNLKNILRPVRAWRARSGGALSIAPAAQLLSLPDRPSIAVLPFANMSGDAEQDYFADGVVEDITTALSRFKTIFVIARNSSFTYKGKAVDVKQVGRELGVRYILEGSVRKAGSRVRITGQLIDSATGNHLWADRFDGFVKDVFDLQDSVTTSVVGAIMPALDKAEIERTKSKRTENLGAYDHYMRGLARIALLSKEGTSEAIGHFREAIRLDPTFSPAYAWTAIGYSRRRQSRWMLDIDRESAEGVRLGRSAIELAPDDAASLAAGGFAMAFLGNDLDAGLSFIDRALSFNPNHALAWQASGWVRSYVGDPETAIEHITRSMRLSPVDPQMAQLYMAMAVAMRCAKRYAESADWAQKALREVPSFLPGLISLTVAQALAGQVEEAKQTLQSALQIDPQLRLAVFSNSVFFRRPEDRDALSNGLRLAGMSE